MFSLKQFTIVNEKELYSIKLAMYQIKKFYKLPLALELTLAFILCMYWEYSLQKSHLKIRKDES